MLYFHGNGSSKLLSMVGKMKIEYLLMTQTLPSTNSLAYSTRMVRRFTRGI